MADGLDEYKSNPMLWCAQAVLELNSFDIDDAVQYAPENVQQLVEQTMEFITASFEAVGLPEPSEQQVLAHTLTHVEELYNDRFSK